MSVVIQWHRDSVLIRKRTHLQPAISWYHTQKEQVWTGIGDSINEKRRLLSQKLYVRRERRSRETGSGYTWENTTQMSQSEALRILPLSQHA